MGALARLFKIARRGIIALRPLSLLGTSGNGLERHWKANHRAQPQLLEHAIAHFGLVVRSQCITSRHRPKGFAR